MEKKKKFTKDNILPTEEYNFKTATLNERSGFRSRASKTFIDMASFQTEYRDGGHRHNITLKREDIS